MLGNFRINNDNMSVLMVKNMLNNCLLFFFFGILDFILNILCNELSS